MLKKLGIILMMAVLIGIVTGSQMLGERLYAWVDQREAAESKEENKTENGEIESYKAVAESDAVETTGNAETSRQKEGKKEENEIKKDTEKDVQKEEKVIILDSGHGGKDPGKIGINGALESEVNLEMSKKIKIYLEEQGFTVIMTRTDEQGLADSKVEDLKARVALINEKKPLMAVSIHQNSYSGESIHGAQVFYYTHSQNGEKAAKILQETMREVDPDNTRQEKANDTYYLLKKTEPMTIIVECGFLSNQEEADKLITEDYQQKMAAAIAKGIQRYLDEMP